MAVLGCLAKLKRRLELAFGAHFLHDFSIKNMLYLILYLWAKFQYHTLFLSQKTFLIGFEGLSFGEK